MSKCAQSPTSPAPIMACKYYNASIQADNVTCVTWRLFFPQCPKINPNQICSSTHGAFVAAVTVCNQRLF